MSGSFELQSESAGAGEPAAAAPPSYDRAMVRPGIVHFGTGRRFRAAVAPLVDRFLAMGHWDSGIVAVSQTGGAVHQALCARDGRFRLIECDGQRQTEREIAAILSVKHGGRDAADIIASIADARVSIITLTVNDQTLCVDAEDRLDANHPDIARELAGAADPVTPIGQIVAGLAARRAAGLGGLTIMNCDNRSGSHLRIASLVDAMAVARDVQLADWIAMKCRFPAVYADRLLVSASAAAGDVSAVATESYIHWVVEDHLGSERAALEDAGVNLVGEVAPFLTMRQRLLDGAMLLLGCAGMLRGHTTVDKAYGEAELAALFDAYLAEAAATLPPIAGFDLDRYVAQIRPRLENRAMRLPLTVCVHDSSSLLMRGALATMIETLRCGRSPNAAATLIAAWIIHCTSPDLDDPHAEALWQIAAEAGDDWPALVRAICGYVPIFGSAGKNPAFQDCVIRSAAHLPGLGSLIDG